VVSSRRESPPWSSSFTAEATRLDPSNGSVSTSSLTAWCRASHTFASATIVSLDDEVTFDDLARALQTA
jgi:hypothetical protein